MRSQASVLLLASATFASFILAAALPGNYRSHPYNREFQTAYGEDEDIDRFNAAVAGNGDIDPTVGTAHTAGEPQEVQSAYSSEEEALRAHIPARIAGGHAVREFDEDLVILGDGDETTNPEDSTTESPDPNPTLMADSIPASEIAADFPEFKEPKNFSTEKVDYTIRTSSKNPTQEAPSAEGKEDAGEENSNVAVFSDDKSFHWSGGNGESLPKNDPEFVKAMGWITERFGKQNGGKSKGKKRVKTNVKENGVFDVFGNL